MTHRARVAGGTWFVLIAHGKQQGPNAKVAAMSAPVYVSVDGGGFGDPSDVPALAAGMKEQLQKMMAPSVQEEYEIEAWDTRAPRFKYWPAQVPLLQRRIDAASAVYDDLSERAKQQRCRADPSFASEAAASR